MKIKVSALFFALLVLGAIMVAALLSDLGGMAREYVQPSVFDVPPPVVFQFL